jgi:hypothetical protein
MERKLPRHWFIASLVWGYVILALLAVLSAVVLAR